MGDNDFVNFRGRGRGNEVVFATLAAYVLLAIIKRHWLFLGANVVFSIFYCRVLFDEDHKPFLLKFENFDDGPHIPDAVAFTMWIVFSGWTAIHHPWYLPGGILLLALCLAVANFDLHPLRSHSAVAGGPLRIGLFGCLKKFSNLLDDEVINSTGLVVLISSTGSFSFALWLLVNKAWSAYVLLLFAIMRPRFSIAIFAVFAGFSVLTSSATWTMISIWAVICFLIFTVSATEDKELMLPFDAKMLVSVSVLTLVVLVKTNVSKMPTSQASPSTGSAVDVAGNVNMHPGVARAEHSLSFHAQYHPKEQSTDEGLKEACRNLKTDTSRTSATDKEQCYQSDTHCGSSQDSKLVTGHCTTSQHDTHNNVGNGQGISLCSEKVVNSLDV